MNTTLDTFPTLLAGSTVIIHKGCQARDVFKGVRATIREIVPGERGSARVVLVFGATGGYPTGRVVSFYVQHTNRLNDCFPAMNDGNPSHRIQVRRPR